MKSLLSKDVSACLPALQELAGNRRHVLPWVIPIGLLSLLHTFWVWPLLGEYGELREQLDLEHGRIHRYEAKLAEGAGLDAKLSSLQETLGAHTPLAGNARGAQQLATSLNRKLDRLRPNGLEKRRYHPPRTVPWGNLTETQFHYDLAGDITALAHLAAALDATSTPLAVRRFCIRASGRGGRGRAPLDITLHLAALAGTGTP